MAGTVAVVAAAATTATLAVAPRLCHNGIDLAITPGVANAQSLVLLANDVAAAPSHDDATLVFHRSAATGEHPFTGAGLYLENSSDHDEETPAGRPAAIAGRAGRGSAGPEPPDHSVLDDMARIRESLPGRPSSPFR